MDYVVAGPNIKPRALPYYSIEVIWQIIIDLKSQYISYDEYISDKNKEIRLLTKPKVIFKIKTRNTGLKIFKSVIYKRRVEKSKNFLKKIKDKLNNKNLSTIKDITNRGKISGNNIERDLIRLD